MNVSKNRDKEKKKKKNQSIIEKELMSMLQAGLKNCIDQALDEVLKDFNKK